MNSLDFIFQRRSIRKFTDAAVEDEVLEQLLRAAMAAPSAMNTKPWRFIVVQEPDRLERLRGVMPFAKMKAAAAISVCADLRGPRNLVTGKFWQQDCSAATQNVLLAATALGLGAGMVIVNTLGRRRAPVGWIGRVGQFASAILAVKKLFARAGRTA